jgi:hypothetical protein
MGPRSGRGLGFCSGFDEPGWTRGGGWGRGGRGGWGRGRWGPGRGGRGPGRGWGGWYADDPDVCANDERAALERERSTLARRLKALDSLLGSRADQPEQHE